MKQRPMRLFLADPFPSLNKGEMAILFGMLKTFETLGEVDVSILSLYPSVDRKRYPKKLKIIDVTTDLYIDGLLRVMSYARARILTSLLGMLQHIFFGTLYAILGEKATKIMNKRIWMEYCKSDVIIICHDQANCVFGVKFLFLSPVYLTLLAKTLGKPIVIYANGTTINAKYMILWKIFARYVLNTVDLITTREEETFKLLRNTAGNKAQIYLTGDPAILLSPTSHSEVRRIMLEEGIHKDNELLIGLTLTREVLNAYNPWKSKGNYKKAIAAIAKLLDLLTKCFNARIVFLPHGIEPYKNRDDRDVAKDVFHSMQNKHKVVLITREYSPQELKGLMGIFDLFIGTRVHSVIGSISMGIPSITLVKSEDKRAYGLIGKMLKQKEWMYNIEDFKQKELLSKIVSLLSRRAEVRKNLIHQTRVVEKKALLNGELLKVLLNSPTRKGGS